MKNYQQGEIVLLPIPFTDLSSSKQRPCLIISNKDINNDEDIIVLAVTSQKTLKNTVKITLNELISGALPKTSFIKTNKIFSLHKSLVRKSICIIKPEVLKEALKKLCQHVE